MTDRKVAVFVLKGRSLGQPLGPMLPTFDSDEDAHRWLEDTGITEALVVPCTVYRKVKISENG